MTYISYHLKKDRLVNQRFKIFDRHDDKSNI